MACMFVLAPIPLFMIRWQLPYVADSVPLTRSLILTAATLNALGVLALGVAYFGKKAEWFGMSTVYALCGLTFALFMGGMIMLVYPIEGYSEVGYALPILPFATGMLGVGCLFAIMFGYAIRRLEKARPLILPH